MRTNKRFETVLNIVTDFFPDPTSKLGLMLPITRTIRSVSPGTYKNQCGTVRFYARRIEAKFTADQPAHLVDYKRGVCSLTFTGKPRKRMINTMNQWNIPDNFFCYFMTLTYPDQWPLSWKIWKQDLEKFRRKLLTQFPDMIGFWRLELQERGAPHFHLVVATSRKARYIRKITKTAQDAVLRRFKRKTVPTITNRRLYGLVRAWWAEIAHQDDQYQGEYATRVDCMDEQSAIFKYMGKYASKPGKRPVTDDGEYIQDTQVDGYETMGRFWGKIGKPSTDPVAEFAMINSAAIEQLKYVMAGLLRKVGAYYADYLAGTPPLMSWDCVGIPGHAVLLIIDQLRLGALIDPDERARVLSSI